MTAARSRVSVPCNFSQHFSKSALPSAKQLFILSAVLDDRGYSISMNPDRVEMDFLFSISSANLYADE